jgi:hypothetical protein
MIYESDESNSWSPVERIVHPEYGDMTEEVAFELMKLGGAELFCGDGVEKIRMAEVQAREMAVAAKFLGLDRQVGGAAMQLQARIPPMVYHYWGQRLGYACWEQKEFVEGYMLKHFDELRVKYEKPGNVVVV